MFEKAFIRNAINHSSENPLERRRFLRAAGLSTLGAGAMAMTSAGTASAAPAISDGAILNFALNLEYLEAEFYQRAVYGQGLPDNLVGGVGTPGPVSGGRAVPFSDPVIRGYAQEIADDEREHVAYLRSALGSAAVARPAIDIDASFTAAAQAAGLIQPGETFDVYANDQNFLLGAFVFEDVGVTAYKGAAPLISSKTFLDAAAGILAVEAYHAGIIRTSLYNMGLQTSADAISNARGSLGGGKDQGISGPNLIPADGNGIAFGRTPGEVLDIVYLKKGASAGGFFPAGANGDLKTGG
ncbi:hypothetical protein TUM20985_33390 [Mycobacterium antarcticum]|uniref:ferritin-like domain-containing protein n=1 Tax=unclassified Mycolicibacterium TaxID=2636767 RepID=UPI002387ACF4|nr:MULTISPECIES: ferritin-like domain-containing protein [unclassified Mycolicibacterium]BDX32792.1 hypothetical protein TUM20985_33390 [Mycolicibacterium sp. TUM20985]GLP78114.1 hypothetical protein TUM20983_52240 [Mycolicibacterium sp. TUM20983]